MSWVVALLAMYCLQAARAQTKISAAASTIQLQDGQTSGSVNLVFKVEGLKKEQLSLVPKLSPLHTSKGGPSLAVGEKPTVVAELKNGAFWQVPVHVDGLPLNSAFTAPVLVQFDRIGDVLSYTITNVLPAVETDVSPGSDTIQLEKSRETQFTVNVKGRALRGLSVCQSTLADANTGTRLGEQYLGMYLGSSEAAANPQIGSQYLTLSAPSTIVRLFVSPTYKAKGVFGGTVGLCSASKASVATLRLTVNSSEPRVRIVGAFLIVLGIALYVLVTVILRQRSRQLTAMLPASRLVEALRGLQASAKRVSHEAKVELPVLLGKGDSPHSLEWLISQLSLKELKKDGFLPPLLTNPFQPADIGTEYQQSLQGMSTQELNLAVLVREGLERVMSLWPKLNEESARNGLEALDELARQADLPDPMRPKVEGIVRDISPRAREFVASLANLSAGPAATPSVHEITVQLEYLSGMGWLIWAFLSFLIGCAVLILSNHGFGTWQDLLKCFLWGLGIQAVGQGLQMLSPSSAVSAFSLQIGR
jgi:hypothetical protein